MRNIAAVTIVALALGAGAGGQTVPPAGGASEQVTVYRVSTCNCCVKWMDHLEAAGFEVTGHVVENLEEAPERERVPEELRSCHIAIVGGYIVEGHVPADVVADLLSRRPEIEGIAVPGMPMGSPGMESPNPQPYEVIAFENSGRTWTFARR
jgi:hypothetical protein